MYARIPYTSRESYRVRYSSQKLENGLVGRKYVVQPTRVKLAVNSPCVIGPTGYRLETEDV